MAKEPTWEAAVQQVLLSANQPLHYSEIADRVVADQIKRSVGATPPATVAATLTRMLKDPDCGITRVGKGYYASVRVIVGDPTDSEVVNPEDPSEAGALSAFGMYWRRDLVMWDSRPRLLGRQSIAAESVDFSGQVGVYLLHDRDRVIYVGRASESILTRLKAHTVDRLSGRWDRFSWFNLKGVDESGNLRDLMPQWDAGVVIDAMEALLVESLEPPLNRRRGDNLGSVEYIQAEDPEIRRREKKRVLAELARNVGIDD